MKKIWPWILGISILLIVVVMLFGTGLLSIRRSPMTLGWGGETDRVWGDGYWHHRGMGMRWGLPVMGLFGWLFVLLIPLSFIGLIVLGVVLLVKAINPSNRKPPERQVLPCSNCGKRVEPDWSVCPHCGEHLGGG